MQAQQQKNRLAVKNRVGEKALAVLPKQTVSILDYVRNHGRVTTRDMVRKNSASPNPLQATFDGLAKKCLRIRYGGDQSIY